MIMRIVVALLLVLSFSDGIIANNKLEIDNKSVVDTSNSSINLKLRYVGWCADGAGFTIYVYTDETYYYGSVCDPEHDLSKEGCLPERLYKDDYGWHTVYNGEKYYLYYYYRGDKLVVRNIERDVYRD